MTWPGPRVAASPAGLAALRADVVLVWARQSPRRRARPDTRPEITASAVEGPAASAAASAMPDAVPASATGAASPNGQGGRRGGGGGVGTGHDGPGAHRPSSEIEDLVARARRGEQEAFGEIYDRYLDVVYKYVLYRIGHVAQAEDIVSETFLRALRRIDTFTWQGRDLGAWLVTIARNLIIDHVKSSRYRLEVPTGDIVSDAPAQVVAGPEDSVLAGVTSAALVDAVRTLNPAQQECLVLRFLHSMSVHETALAMGKNEAAVKALQYRAVRALARSLPPSLI